MDTSGSRFITIFRKPEGLFALFTRPRFVFHVCLEPRHRRRNQNLDELNTFYELHEVPLRDVSSKVCPDKDRLLRAQERLQQMAKRSPAAVTDLLLLASLTHLPFSSENESNCSTLYGQACNHRSAHEILKSCGCELRNDEMQESLPARFHVLIAPYIKKSPRSTWNTYLRIFWSLSLQSRPWLLNAVSRLASFENHETVAAWMRVIERQLPNRQSAFTAILLESLAILKETDAIDFGIFDHLTVVSKRRSYIHRVLFLMQSIVRGIKPAAIRRFIAYAPSNAFLEDLDRPPDISDDVLLRWLRYIHGCRGHYRSFAVHLLQTCAKLQGFGDLLDSINPRETKPRYAFMFLCVFVKLAVWQSHSDQELHTTWQYMKSQFQQTWKAMCSLPEPRKQDFLDEVARMIHPGRELQTEFKNVLAMLFKFYRLSDKTPEILSWRIHNLVHSAKPMVDALVYAPDLSWRQLGKRYIDNPMSGTNTGLCRMLRAIRYFTIKCFHHCPTTLLEVAKHIGGLLEGRATQILAAFRRHPIMMEAFGHKTNAEIIDYFAAHKDLLDPVPRRFKQYAGVSGALSRQRIRRYRKVFYVNLHNTRLAVLEQMIQTQWKKPISDLPYDAPPSALHASRILCGSSFNKRAGKRFLRAYLQGDRAFVWNHPRTRMWLRAHTWLNAQLWMEGICVQGEVKPCGSVTLQMEQDPLEAWKLGTHVQSCLSVGAFNQDFATAVVIDVNKRVIYARDHQNRVVGRQLLAISEEKKLVCFRVYPTTASKALQKLFRKYDVLFAEALGVPLHISMKEPYTIATILAQNWYDDDAWNPLQP